MSADATVQIPGNLDTCGGELQNVKFQGLVSNPNATERDYWYDSTNHEPVYHNGTSVVPFGRVYSSFTGADGTNAGTSGLVPAPSATDNVKFLCGDGTYKVPTGTTYTFSTGLTESSGTVVVTDYSKLLKNLASDAEINNGALNISSPINATGDYSISIGNGAKAAGDNCIAIGGNSAKIGSSLHDTIQLGYGAADSNYSFFVGFYGYSNYKMLDGATGLIPDARLSSNIARTSDIPTVPTKLSDFTDDLGSSPTHTHSQYLNSSLKGANNGLAELDANGKVPSSQLPAYVDDVIDLLTVASSAPSTCAKGDKYYNTSSSKIFTATATNTWGSTGATPESDIIYVATDTNATYRWSGSTMVNLSNPIGQATESSAGIAEIATTAEVTAGTDDTRIVTPSKLAGALSNYASATKTLTNTTFNANGTGNSISNIEVADFASGVVRTQSDGIRGVSNASDSAFATEKAIADAIKNFITGITSSDVTTALGYIPAKKVVVTCPALTKDSDGIITWTITNSFGSNEVGVDIYSVGTSSNKKIYPAVEVTSSEITVTMFSSSNKSAGDLKAIITG